MIGLVITLCLIVLAIVGYIQIITKAGYSPWWILLPLSIPVLWLIAVFTTFVITPLVFVGGVFTSAQFLPPFVRQVSLFNPMFYMIDAFRFSFTGRSDVPLQMSLAIVGVLTCAAFAAALRMTAVGFKLRV